MRSALFLLFISLTLGPTAGAADQGESYYSEVPSRICPWPEAFETYQVLPASESPDRAYGFIVAKAPTIDERANAKLYLVQLKSFRVVSEIVDHDAVYNGQRSYSVLWSSDSSSSLFIVDHKWGPENVFLVSPLRDQTNRTIDLMVEVRKQVQADFDQSKSVRFNTYYDFIFTSEDYIRDLSGKPQEEIAYWKVNDRHQVEIKCICTNDPKHGKDRLWEVIFTGTWDITKAAFIHQDITHVSKDRLPAF